MRLELTGRHIKITPTVRTLVEDGLAHTLRKLNGSAVSAQVVLTQEKTRVHAEATLHAKGERFLHGEGTGRDVPRALAAVLAKVDRQAQRVKNKWADGKRQGIPIEKGTPAAPRPQRAGRLVAADEPSAAGGARVIRTRRYVVKQMSVDDAASVVGDTPNSFVVFREPGAGAVSIVFRRPDGNVGLIEPGA